MFSWDQQLLANLSWTAASGGPTSQVLRPDKHLSLLQSNSRVRCVVNKLESWVGLATADVDRTDSTCTASCTPHRLKLEPCLSTLPTKPARIIASPTRPQMWLNWFKTRDLLRISFQRYSTVSNWKPLETQTSSFREFEQTLIAKVKTL